MEKIKIEKDEQMIRWYFIEYISNHCDVNNLTLNVLEKAVMDCSFVIGVHDQKAYELFMAAGQSVAKP